MTMSFNERQTKQDYVWWKEPHSAFQCTLPAKVSKFIRTSIENRDKHNLLSPSFAPAPPNTLFLDRLTEGRGKTRCLPSKGFKRARSPPVPPRSSGGTSPPRAAPWPNGLNIVLAAGRALETLSVRRFWFTLWFTSRPALSPAGPSARHW